MATAAAPASTSSADDLLVVQSLCRDFGGVRAVDQVTFSVPTGTIVGLMGPNGAGKSTLVSIVAGEVKPTSGHIRYAGREVTGLSSNWLGRHGLIRTFQFSSEFRSLSLLENLLVGRRAHPGERLRVAFGPQRRWRADEAEAVDAAWLLLKEFGLARLANDKAGTLSGGQRRLVELMRALMASPQMLLLDEPVAGLARGTGDIFLDHLLRLRDDGLTILLVEHELRALHRVADGVVVMARGSLIMTGMMSEVVEHPEVIRAYVSG